MAHQPESIAGALINRPSTLLAHNPTAPLGSTRAMAMMNLLERLAAQIGSSVIVVTHAAKILQRFLRIDELLGGVVLEVGCC